MLTDDWRYLFLDGVSLRIRRPAGRKRVQLLVAYGVRADGTRHLLGFTRSTGESQAAWEGLLHELYGRGLERRQLQLIVRRPSRRSIPAWLISAAGSTSSVICGCPGSIRRRVGRRPSRLPMLLHAGGGMRYPALVTRLRRDLPELLAFFHCPRALWRKLRTT